MSSAIPEALEYVASRSRAQLQADLLTALHTQHFPALRYSPERDWVVSFYEDCFRYLPFIVQQDVRAAGTDLLAKLVVETQANVARDLLLFLAYVQATDAVPYLRQLFDRLAERAGPAELDSEGTILLDDIFEALHGFVLNADIAELFESLFFGSKLAERYAIPLLTGLLEAKPAGTTRYLQRFLYLYGRAPERFGRPSVALRTVVRLATVSRIAQALEALQDRDATELARLLCVGSQAPIQVELLDTTTPRIRARRESYWVDVDFRTGDILFDLLTANSTQAPIAAPQDSLRSLFFDSRTHRSPVPSQ
jgi:hypothetical protein